MDNTLLQPQNMPPLTKYTISDYGRKSYNKDTDVIISDEIEITGYEDKEEGLEVKFSRDGLKSVVIELSVPQQFTRDAYDKLCSLFEMYGMNACCNLNVYQRDDVSVNSYTKLKTFALDFSTIAIHDDYIAIQIEKNDLQTFIKSGGKTKFDYDVTEFPKSLAWHYERMNVTAEALYTIPEMQQTTGTLPENTPWIFPLFFQLNKYSAPFDAPRHQASTQDSYNYDNEGSIYPWFFKSVQPVSVSIALKFDFTANFYTGTNLKIELRSNDTVIDTLKDYSSASSPVTDTIDYNDTILLSGRQPLTLSLSGYSDNGAETIIDITSFETFRLTYQTIGKNRYIGCVDPSNLLQWLIDSMTDNRGYTGSIEWDETMLYQSVIACSDSIRLMPTQVMHTSFNDFAEWMRVKGYEYEIDNMQLTFRKRDNIFDASTVIAELGDREVADLVIEADTDNAYNALEIGYEKQDYGENTIGYIEANGKFDYKTDLISQGDNMLSLISPYRADSIGIELLCWEESTDSGKKSDNDIFEIAVQLVNVGGFYATYEDITMTCNGTTLFNAILNPYYMLKDNLSLLGIITENLFFEASDAFRQATVSDGTNIYDNVTINQDESQLFKPYTVNFALSSHIKMPVDDSKNGIIQLPYKGKTYKGFLKDATRNYTRESETDMTLFLKSITAD